MKLYKVLIALSLLVGIFPLQAQSVLLESPNKHIALHIYQDNGQLYVEAMKNGKNVIMQSPVVFEVSGDVLTSQCTLGAPKTYQVDETYPIRGIHSTAVNQANGVIVPLLTKGSDNCIFEARAYNDGIAFRLSLSGKKGVLRTPDESTVLKVAENSNVWYHNMYAHYEGIHQKQKASLIKKGEWAAPPVVIELPEDEGYLCLTEAALRNYAGMSFQSDGECGFVTRLGHTQPIGYPFTHDYNLELAKELSIPASIEGDIFTPWRCVIIANDLNALVNTDMITNLSPEPDKKLFPKGIHTDWIKPGRSVWCWLDGGNRTLEGMKEFSRLAGELGYEYNTVDAFWYRWTDEQIKELVDYSNQYGVKIWLWRHGRDVRDPQKRKALFERCQRLGIVGLKLDAFSNESKDFVDLYQACLREAAEYKLMLNIHGSNKPTGEVRSWPNEMSREGVHGLEYGKHQFEWSTHNVTLPFTRFVAGAGDYTPVVFGERRLETSWCHQIATAFIFNSSVIFFGAHPQSILDNPAVDLLKSIPADWDETIVLPDSKIGEVAAFARRKGETWYLAVLNGTEERILQFPLDFLGNGWYEAVIYKDRPGDGASLKKERSYCRNTDSFTARMRAGGGYIVKFNLKEK